MLLGCLALNLTVCSWRTCARLAGGKNVCSPSLTARQQHLVLGILRDGALVGEYHSLNRQRNYPNSIDLGMEIKPTAFRDPILKQLHSEASILENDEVVRQGVNEAIKFAGLLFF